MNDGIGAGKRAGVVRFSKANAELVVSLPKGSQDVHLVGLRMDAQASDAYSIEGSYDGSSFKPIGVSKAGRGARMRSRLFRFNDLLDLEEPSGPGASAKEPAAQAQRQHDLSLGVVLDASRSHELIIAAAPLDRARLDVSINGELAGTLDIAPSRTTHHVDVPPGVLQDGKVTQVALTPASISPRADVRIRSLLFRASQ